MHDDDVKSGEYQIKTVWVIVESVKTYFLTPVTLTFDLDLWNLIDL